MALPDAVFKAQNGTSPETWAAGSTAVNSPTWSDDAADTINGWPVVSFDASSSQRLDIDSLATYFSGDDPDFTMAFIFRPKTASGAKTLFGGGAASGTARFEVLRVTGTPTLITNRRDALGTENSLNVATAGNISYGTEYLAIVKQSGTTRSGLLHRISDGVEVSNSGTVDVASTTMTKAAFASDVSGGATDQYWEGDIARVWLYDSALTGDLTGDLTGTQLGELKQIMLLNAPTDTVPLSEGAMGGIIGRPLRGRM